IQNKIKPMAACLTAVDSATPPRGVTIGMDSSGTRRFLGKEGIGRFVAPIMVKKGDIYYIVLDNVSSKGSGHTIKVSVHVDCFTPTVQFYDPKAKKYIDVDLLILEKNTDNRPVAKNPRFKNGKVNLVPGFNYTLYAKKEGYFPVYKEFNADICKEDTVLRFIMQQAKVGTTLPVADIYFNDDVQLLEASDTTLMSYVAMFQNYPELQFRIKGYVESYGIDMDRDIKISQDRASVVRQFFIDHGIDAGRMTVTGMTQNEIRRSAAAALNKNKPFNDAKVEITITDVKK
ncbi:MAG: OmpA family protein, partial [Bacteroidales bacterium]|nr:OmpA family protein [Bacteroidales bacterium]